MPDMCAVSTGLPDCAWAAALPVNAERLVGKLVQDIYGDHQHIVSSWSLLSCVEAFLRDLRF